nr:CDGSH iron-sulfur domain-containing protein 3, mitochondrial isoform X1 [Peromyscus maniculatus bairdii]
MPRPASAATLFPTLLSLPRPLSLWSFPSQMGFRRPPFSPDFIFLFPNHICRPALWKLCQRREISSWLARWFPKDPAKPVVAQKTPIRLELVAGKTYRWCVCGRSKKQIQCGGLVAEDQLIASITSLPGRWPFSNGQCCNWLLLAVTPPSAPLFSSSWAPRTCLSPSSA